jgi:hypothetical protein
MSTSKSRRSKGKQISYVEVDSDADMLSDEELKVVDQVGRGRKKGKRSRASLDEGSDAEDYSDTEATGESFRGPQVQECELTVW